MPVYDVKMLVVDRDGASEEVVVQVEHVGAPPDTLLYSLAKAQLPPSVRVEKHLGISVMEEPEEPEEGLCLQSGLSDIMREYEVGVTPLSGKWVPVWLHSKKLSSNEKAGLIDAVGSEGEYDTPMLAVLAVVGIIESIRARMKEEDGDGKD